MSFEEREEVSRAIAGGQSARAIARALRDQGRTFQDLAGLQEMRQADRDGGGVYDVVDPAELAASVERGA